ncbi:MAG: outer membrane lipoprotein carrier protein LolA [Candidatus Kapabacteria bacterium]|nr:outer membrane lipoprotein carrier protein LolA [Candidatus Kapabacteria bacterium]
MQKLNSIIRLPLLLIILFSTLNFQLNAQYTAETLFAEIQKTFKNLKSVSFNFLSENNPNLKGNIKAETGNKYFIKMTERHIISNGKIVWNYSLKDKKVIINEIPKNDSEFSIENFFFSFLNNYKPKDLKKETSSGRGFNYLLTLIPSNPSSENNISSIQLEINQKSLLVSSVQINYGNYIDKWNIENLELNPKIKSDIFSFQPTKDMEVIDLR